MVNIFAMGSTTITYDNAATLPADIQSKLSSFNADMSKAMSNMNADMSDMFHGTKTMNMPKNTGVININMSDDDDKSTSMPAAAAQTVKSAASAAATSSKPATTSSTSSSAKVPAPLVALGLLSLVGTWAIHM